MPLAESWNHIRDPKVDPKMQRCVRGAMRDNVARCPRQRLGLRRTDTLVTASPTRV
jgi:hypothetical protein